VRTGLNFFFFFPRHLATCAPFLSSLFPTRAAGGRRAPISGQLLPSTLERGTPPLPSFAAFNGARCELVTGSVRSRAAILLELLPSPFFYGPAIGGLVPPFLPYYAFFFFPAARQLRNPQMTPTPHGVLSADAPQGVWLETPGPSPPFFPLC